MCPHDKGKPDIIRAHENPENSIYQPDCRLYPARGRNADLLRGDR